MAIITKEELGLALERLALALSATGLGVWERDIASNRVTWSDTMYRLFGRTREEFSGDPDEVLSFVHPDDRAEFRQGYMAALQDQHDFFEQEFRIVRPNGEVRWVHRRGRVRRGRDGQARSVLGVALDITERKQAEEANARLASLVSGADDAIIGMTLGGIILTWNPAAERLFGYQAEEMIGHSVRILYPGRRRRRVRRALRARARRRAPALRRRAPAARRHAGARVGGRDTRARQERRRRRRVVDRARHNGAQAHRAAAGRDAGAADADQQPAQDGAGGRRHGHLRGRHRARQDHLVRRDLRAGRRRAHLGHAVDGRHRALHSSRRSGHARAARRAEAFAGGGAYENEFRIVRPDGEVRWIYVRAPGLAHRRQARAGRMASAWTSPSARSARRTSAS